MAVFLLHLEVLQMFACGPAALTNMRRSPYTSKFSAVLLCSLLAVALVSASQSVRNLQDPVRGIRAAGADKEPHETGVDMLSHERSSGAASPKAERVDFGDPVSFHSNALRFGPHADVKFPHQIPLPLYFSGHFDKQDNKEDNGDHPLPDEPGAEVHCWNQAHVFDFVLPASEVAKHFPNECQQPLSCNTTCVAKVPGSEVCARLQSGCTEPPLNAVQETQLETTQNENKQLESFEKNVEGRLSELDAKLAQLSLESGYHKDKLIEFGRNLNHLSEALKELAAASVKNLDSLDRNTAEVKALLNEKSKSTMTAISSVLSVIQSDSKTHLLTLKGYAKSKEKAIERGWYWIMGEKVYMGRYLISWGIAFQKRTDGVTLYLRFQLHKGISDEFLEWPFSNKLKLSIIHPESGEKQEGRDTPNTILKNFARPLEASNWPVYFQRAEFDSSHLERNGYVQNDQLLLKLEILS